ncbi:hypothetical protein SESBI_35459 [Sesbania bispinosa]|nr:hypothetical protein SESBI_35459 [Sesbania bispinosa]
MMLMRGSTIAPEFLDFPAESFSSWIWRQRHVTEIVATGGVITSQEECWESVGLGRTTTKKEELGASTAKTLATEATLEASIADRGDNKSHGCTNGRLLMNKGLLTVDDWRSSGVNQPTATRAGGSAITSGVHHGVRRRQKNTDVASMRLGQNCPYAPCVIGLLGVGME